MKRYFYIIIAIITCNLLIRGQEESSPIYFNNEGLTLDSLYYEIVCNAKIPYAKKMDILFACSYFITGAQKEKQVSMFNQLIAESKKERDFDGLVFLYTSLASHHLAWNDVDAFNTYTDSTDMYASYLKRPKTLLNYYYNKGFRDFNTPYGLKECYAYYDKALDCLEKLPADDNAASSIIYNIVGDISLKPDTTFMQNVAKKIGKYIDRKYDPTIDIPLCILKSDLFKCYYDHYRQEAMLDSAIFYYQKLIEIYDKTEGIDEGFLTHVEQGYLFISEYCALKSNPDWAYINDCISKVKLIGDTSDVYVASKLCFTEAFHAYMHGDYQKAEDGIVCAEQLLQKTYEEEVMFAEMITADEIKNADLHSKILYAQQRYEEAAHLNKIKNGLKLKVRNDETRELEYLYRTEDEERKIEQLQTTHANRDKFTRMLVLFSFVLISIFVFLSVWSSLAKKKLEKYALRLKAETEKTEGRLIKKGQEAEKTKMDNLEVYSDFKIKEMKLEEKNGEIEKLMKEKERLSAKIKECAAKIEEYEKQNAEEVQNGDNADVQLRDLVMEDIERLIEKKLEKKKDLIPRLDYIDEQYISTLKKAYDGKLSNVYMKYCICFVIGMSVNDVSECFSVEPASVHMARYRMKRKFGLDGGEDLDSFLIRHNGNRAALLEFGNRKE